MVVAFEAAAPLAVAQTIKYYGSSARISDGDGPMADGGARWRERGRDDIGKMRRTGRDSFRNRWRFIPEMKEPSEY